MSALSIVSSALASDERVRRTLARASEQVAACVESVREGYAAASLCSEAGQLSASERERLLRTVGDRLGR